MFNSEEDKRQIDAYIFHGTDDVVIGLFREDKMLSYRPVSKRELGEKWVENFENVMRVSNVSLGDIRAIYLNNSFST